jgi:hypothetical protein
MNIYAYTNELFRHVIAAKSREEAREYTVREIRNGVGGIVPLVEVVAPDAMTRRMAAESVGAREIDRLPVFHVERYAFAVSLDVSDDLSQMTADDERQNADASTFHKMWIAALIAPCDFAINAAIEVFDTDRTRALAGAWGLGPVPAWLAPILPAAIAMEAEACAAHWSGELAAMTVPEWLRIAREIPSPWHERLLSLAAAGQLHSVLGPERYWRPAANICRRILADLDWTVDRAA